MLKKDSHSGSERRKYIRLDSVFPIQFRLVTLDGKHFVSNWLQGFTNNVSKGGICLAVSNLNPELADNLKRQQAKLALDIEIPIAGKPVSAIAKVAWVREVSKENNRYLVGLSYEEIDKGRNSGIMRYAWTKKLFVPAVFSFTLILGLGFAINSLINIKLIRGNRALVEQLVGILRESSAAKQKIKSISKEKEELQLRINALQLRIKTVEDEKGRSETAKRDALKELNSMLGKLNQEKVAVQEQLISLQGKESDVTEELLRLDKRKTTLEKANLDKMYKWVTVHQNPRTGLVMSFEGDIDLADWAFTYDQALVAMVYTSFSDFERAKKILDFFQEKAKRIDGRFLNAYYANDGNPAEYTVHNGPNIWLGIAIVHYTQKTKDTSYLGIAEDIANGIIYMQIQDADGGIRGGPNVEWYSTEHNLDAHAFFNMLYKLTGKEQYLRARDRTLNWLAKHTYDKVDIPIKRGKGDSTIATDTYAWSIAAVGPQKLEALGMNPDRIMEFAEQNCSVEVDYNRPEGKTVKIKGFDFAPQKHLARGQVVSSEWTAQMILAFKIMAEFYYKKEMPAKARAWDLKANTYLSELGKMIISSASPSGQGESCLPYATQDFVDTGHGWMTPKGKNSGSVSGTVYTLFAYYNYNPLELK